MPAITRITKAEKAAFAAYQAAGGSRSIKQYVALARGRALSPVTQKLTGQTETPKASKHTKKAAKAVQTIPVSELLRAPSGSRVDFMGGNLVVDEAGANLLMSTLVENGFAAKTVGFQHSNRRGLRVQIQVPAEHVQEALTAADMVGFRTWAAA